MTTKDGGSGIPDKIIAEVSRVVIGKDDIKQLLLLSLLSQGHVLIEGSSGTAKTTIARTFAQTIGGTFKRVQGTPDMLPADILGFYFYRTNGTSTFMPGPIFANVLLADELNRTATRTQSALLEAMQENQVTIERVTHHLEQPFIVIASQIPYGGTGTTPQSEIQLDRFLFRTWSNLPSVEEEDHILKNIDAISEPQVSAVTTPDEIVQLQQEVKNVYIADNIRGYILDIVNRLRRHRDVESGPSPRGSIALFKGARALAFIQGRNYVIPDDVKKLLIPTLSHRLRVSSEADIDNVSAESIINEAAAEVAVPKEGVASRNKPEDIPVREIVVKSSPAALESAAAPEVSTQTESPKLAAESPDKSIAEAVSPEPEDIPAKPSQSPTKSLPQLLKTLIRWRWMLIILLWSWRP
jgi:MoxR-like ATPase